MSWALLAGSLAGVLGLALTARLLGLGGAELADEQEAMHIAEAELPGFEAASAVLAPDRQSAMVSGADGRQVRLRRLGAQFVIDGS
jgi:hypothetical protein